MSHLAVTARGRRAEEGMMAGAEGGWEFERRDRLSKHTWGHANADVRVQMGPQDAHAQAHKRRRRDPARRFKRATSRKTTDFLSLICSSV